MMVLKLCQSHTYYTFIGKPSAIYSGTQHSLEVSSDGAFLSQNMTCVRSKSQVFEYIYTCLQHDLPADTSQSLFVYFSIGFTKTYDSNLNSPYKSN